jgi:hypothetical protein
MMVLLMVLVRMVCGLRGSAPLHRRASLVRGCSSLLHLVAVTLPGILGRGCAHRATANTDTMVTTGPCVNHLAQQQGRGALPRQRDPLEAPCVPSKALQESAQNDVQACSDAQPDVHSAGDRRVRPWAMFFKEGGFGERPPCSARPAELAASSSPWAAA